MALTYVLVQQLVHETTPGVFWFCLVFFLISLTLFCLLQLKSEAARMLEVWALCR